MSEVKYSRNGWPISKTTHKVDSLYMKRTYAEHVRDQLQKEFGIEIELRQPLEDEEHYFELHTAPVRLSMDRCSLIRMFVKGYKAAYR